MEHGDGFDTSHRDSWSPGVKYIASASVVTSIFKSEFVITFTDFRDNNISRIRRSSRFREDVEQLTRPQVMVSKNLHEAYHEVVLKPLCSAEVAFAVEVQAADVFDVQDGIATAMNERSSGAILSFCSLTALMVFLA